LAAAAPLGKCHRGRTGITLAGSHCRDPQQSYPRLGSKPVPAPRTRLYEVRDVSPSGVHRRDRLKHPLPSASNWTIDPFVPFQVNHSWNYPRATGSGTAMRIWSSSPVGPRAVLHRFWALLQFRLPGAKRAMFDLCVSGLGVMTHWDRREERGVRSTHHSTSHGPSTGSTEPPSRRAQPIRPENSITTLRRLRGGC
jgi:hypothetical protein